MSPPKSQSSGALKQSVLSFASTKRTKSASSVKGQKPVTTIKKESTKKETGSTTDSPGRSDEELIESFSEETDGPPPQKKQKVKKLDVKRSKSEGVISSRDNATDDLQALDLKDPKWKKHYKGVKQEAKSMDAVRTIHGGGQSAVHEILRVFDLSYKYGPCVGVSRLDRWKRAESLGLNPPREVQEILLSKQGVEQEELSQSVFYGEV